MRPVVLICSAAVLIAHSSVTSAQTPTTVTESVVRLGEAFEVFSGITYRTQDGWLPTLDVHRPRNQALPTPVVVFFHAERLRNEQQLLVTLPFMEMGFAVVNVEYRPAVAAVRELPDPDRVGAVEDAVCALRWVAAHAREHRFDLSRLVVSGRSSGGHKALVASLSKLWGPVMGCVDADTPTVAAIVNWYGRGSEARETDTPAVRHALSIERMVGIDAPPLLGIFRKSSGQMKQAEALRQLWDYVQRPVDIIVTDVTGASPADTAENLRVWRGVEQFLRKQGVLSP